MFDNQRKQLLEALDTAHEAYYNEEIFGGPSLYFHLQSLDAARTHQFDRFVECAYAMLAAWGMHRMGSRGSKMCDFNEFQSSMKLVWPVTAEIQGKTPGDLTKNDWGCLKSIFCGIRTGEMSQIGVHQDLPLSALRLPRLQIPTTDAFTATTKAGSPSRPPVCRAVLAEPGNSAGFR